MKPHIIKIMGIWQCRHPKSRFSGFGYTPPDAYREWQARLAGKINERVENGC